MIDESNALERSRKSAPTSVADLRIQSYSFAFFFESSRIFFFFHILICLRMLGRFSVKRTHTYMNTYIFSLGTNTTAFHALRFKIIPAAAVSLCQCKCARMVAMIISLLQHYPYRRYCAKRLKGKTLHPIRSYRHVDNHSVGEQ